MCGLWVVLCVGCVLHGLLIPSLCPHQTTTTLPFSSPFTTPLFCLSVRVEKRVDNKVDGVEWSVVCGMQHISHCAFIKPSPTPVCLSSFTIPFSLSNSFSSSFLPCLVCMDRKSEGQVWDSPCQTHCAPHPIHTTLFPSNHTPLFHTHGDTEREKSGVMKGEEKGRVVVAWCGQSDGMSKPCKTQPTHNTTHKPHMPPTPSITHPQHQQVHPLSPFLLCVCGGQRRGKGW